MLENYIKNLYKHVEAENKKKEQVRQKEAASLQTMPPPVKGLEQQLVEFFRTQSQEQLKRPWTMDEIILAGDLKGKYRDRPHPQQVAEILTRYAWTKRRLYGAAYGGKRYWFAPV